MMCFKVRNPMCFYCLPAGRLAWPLPPSRVLSSDTPIPGSRRSHSTRFAQRLLSILSAHCTSRPPGPAVLHLICATGLTWAELRHGCVRSPAFPIRQQRLEKATREALLTLPPRSLAQCHAHSRPSLIRARSAN